MKTRKPKVNKTPPSPRPGDPGGPDPDATPPSGEASNYNCCAIREPELLAAAENARDFMEDAFRELASIRARMFRERFGYIPPGMEEKSLEGIVRGMSTSAACLVGELRTISQKLG